MKTKAVAIALALVALLAVAYFVKADVIDEKTTAGNNGTVSCSTYCSANINGELPAAWNGALAVGQTNMATGADILPTSTVAGVPVHCRCQKHGGGWAAPPQAP